MRDCRWIGKVFDEQEAGGAAIAKKRGNKFNVLPPAEVAKMQLAAERVQQAWVASVTKKGHDGKALLAEAKALIAKYTK